MPIVKSDEGPVTDLPSPVLPTARLAEVVARVPDSLASYDGGGEGDGTASPVTACLHAVRRRWLLAMVLGTVCGGAGAAACWYFQPVTYTVTAVLRLTASEKPLVFRTADQAASVGRDFDTYKKTQKQIVSSQWVINAALRAESVAPLPIVKSKPDPLLWLLTDLKVSFPDDAEIMTVSLSSTEADGLANVVNGIVDEYLREEVLEDRERKQRRFDKLRTVFEKTRDQLTEKRNALTGLANVLGTSDSGALTVVQQTAAQQSGIVRGQLTQVQLKVMEAQLQLSALRTPAAEAAARDADAKAAADEAAKAKAAAEAAPNDKILATARAAAEKKATQSALRAAEAAKKVSESPAALVIPEAVLEEALAVDPEMARLASEQRGIEYVIRKSGEILKAPRDSKYEEKLAKIEKDKQAQRAVVAARIAHTLELTRDDRIKELSSQLNLLTAQEAELQDRMKKFEAEAHTVGRSSTDLEIQRAEIASLEDLSKQLRRELGQTEVEQTQWDPQLDGSEDEASRIEVLSRAGATRDLARTQRYAIVAGAGFLGFFLPVGLVVWVDARKKKIGSLKEVSAGLRLNVIGSLPMLPRRVMRRLNVPTSRNEHWRRLLSECVDSAAARLLLESEGRDQKIIMVTSAEAGEGKTTLAGQLAISLASAGRKVTLVDFDLRRPTLHSALGLKLEPGLGEVLSHQIDIPRALQPTGVDGLSFLSAGRWGRTGLKGLASLDLSGLFSALASVSDYVIVDGSPILPVVDARVIGQHVDAVVVSVLRDVSRGPKVLAACQLLEAFGMFVLGTVVTGSREDVYADSYEPAHVA